jgi:hypothetical protein
LLHHACTRKRKAAEMKTNFVAKLTVLALVAIPTAFVAYKALVLLAALKTLLS